MKHPAGMAGVSRGQLIENAMILAIAMQQDHGRPGPAPLVEKRRAVHIDHHSSRLLSAFMVDSL
jgi:hypothetical protein